MALRTDLAVELKEMYHDSHRDTSDIPGVSSIVEKIDENISITRISINEHIGSILMGKPQGNYITVEAKNIIGSEIEEKEKVASVLAGELKRLIPFDYHLKVLVAGLGNEKITPDSLGPYTLDKVKITRHYFLMFNEDGDEEMACVSGINPGVMGTTGLESAEVIKRTAQIAEADVILAIDSLAARNIDRISSTIQICDTGISPGAGTGNMRTALNEETTGVRVVAIGVPTVIDAKTIVMDSLEKFEIDRTRLEKHVDSKELNMIVTSGEIDQIIKDFSEIIASAINKTLHPGVYN